MGKDETKPVLLFLGGGPGIPAGGYLSDRSERYIGLNMTSVHPELYQAYIAMSQICNQKESEEDYYAYFNAVLRDSSMHELGVGTARNMKSVITGLFLPSLRCRAYSPMERIRIWQGKRFAQDTQPSF